MKRRHGELLIALIVFAFLSFALVGIITSSNATLNVSRVKAQNSGATNSYIAVSNLCADYFVNNLETQAIQVTVADVSFIGDLGDPYVVSQREYAIFETALQYMQSDMMLENVDADKWVYVLTDPLSMVTASGIDHTEALEYLTNLLDSSKIRIIVDKDFAVVRDAMDSLTMTSGDNVAIDTINFTVELTKGLTKITQHYTLTGERLSSVFVDSPYAYVTVDSSSANLSMTSQFANTNKVQSVPMK